MAGYRTVDELMDILEEECLESDQTNSGYPDSMDKQ